MKIAVSGCLLGEEIRFDGGHKRDAFVVDALGKYARLVSFCPEHLAFGSHRPSIRLVEDEGQLKILSNKDGADLTDALRKASHNALEEIRAQDIGGIIFKSKSPTCGMQSAKVYLPNGFAAGKDDGVLAALCKKEFGYLPMEEEGRLNDMWLRENFVMQLFAYDAFETFKKEATMKALVAFHQSYKFLLQSKNEKGYRRLGKIVANHEKNAFEEVLQAYEALFKETIAQKSSIGKTRNVLEHMAGFVKDYLSAQEKQILHGQIADFSARIVPVIVPLSTLKLYATKHDQAYLLGQKFLDPYPKELALRSDIRSVR